MLPLLLWNAAAQCPTSPTDSSCKDFILTNSTQLYSDICTQMPGMTSCSFKSLACSNSDSGYCSSFSLYAAACTDMPKMASCSLYSKMCGPSSVYSQCKEAPVDLVSTADAVKNIYSICNEMSMPGCERCVIKSQDSTYASCNVLDTYSFLCASMPEMRQCKSWSQMCSKNPKLSFCAVTDNYSYGPPQMKMYFHVGFTDYILFDKWVPRTAVEYYLSCLVVFAFALFYEGFSIYVRYMQHNSSSKLDAPSEGNAFSRLAGSNNGIMGMLNSAFYGFIRTVSMGFSYLLMLIAMTFNLGLFLSVIIGIGVGHALFMPVFKVRGTIPEIDNCGC
jgi:hypothetical protein